jgi:hypothetical protein
MMKKIHEKYSISKLDYINLDPLKFKIVKDRSTSFKIVDNTIRRNLPSWKDEKINEQTTVFDLRELCLLSRIHIYDSKVMRLDLEIALDENGPFIKIEKDMDIISGKIRVIKVGSLPCRYFRIKVKKGCPISEFKNVECFGLHINDIKNKFDEDTLDILFYNSYDLIYSKNSDGGK